MGDQEKRKDRKTWKSRTKEKVVDFSSASIFTARKREAVILVGIKGTIHPTRRKTQGAGIVKDWKDKRDRGRIPDTLMENKNMMNAGPLTLQQLNPDFTTPYTVYAYIKRIGSPYDPCAS